MLRLALQHMVRRPRHTLTMILGIALAISLIFGIFTAVNGITYAVLQKQLDQVAVDFTGYGNYPKYTEVKNMFESVEYVEHVVPALQFSFSGYANKSKLSENVTDESLRNAFILYGIENDTFLVLSSVKLLSGEINLTNGFIITSRIAQLYNLSVGDTLYFLIKVQIYTDVGLENVTYAFNKTVAGIVDLRDKLEKVFVPQTTYGSEQHVLFYDLNLTMQFYKDYYKTLNPDSKTTDYPLRYYIFINREQVIDPWNMDATNQRVDRIYRQLQLKANSIPQPYYLYVYSNLRWALQFVQFWAQGAKSTFAAFSAPTLILGAFLAVTTSYIVLEQRRKEFALLKVRGATNSILTRTMLYEGFVIGISAGVLGIIGGTLLSNYFISRLASVWGTNVPLQSIALSFTSFDAIFVMVLALIFALFSSYLPSRMLKKISPVEAVAEYIPEEEHEEWRPKWTLLGLVLSSYKIIEWVSGFNPNTLMFSILLSGSFILAILLGIFIFIDMLILQYIAPLLFPYCVTKIVTMKIQKASNVFQVILKPIFGGISAFSIRNVQRKAARYARVSFIIALTLSFGMATLITNASNISYSVREIQGQLGADMNILLSSTNWTVYQNFTEMDGVVNSTILARYEATTNLGSSIFYMIDPKSYYWVVKDYFEDNFIDNLDFKTAMNTLETENNSILISENMAEDYNLDVGDAFNITITSATSKNIILPVKVIGIVNFVPGCRDTYYWDFVRFNIAGIPITQSYIILVNIWYLKNASVNIQSSIFHSLVDLSDNANATAIKEELINEFGDAIYDIEILSEEINKVYSDPYTSSIISFLDVQYIFTVIIATIGIGLVMVMAVIERKREIGILIAKGISPRQLVGYLLGEGIIMLVLSLGIGALAGYATGVGFTIFMRSGVGIVYPIKMQIVLPFELYIFLLSSLTAFLVAMLIPAYIATRIKPHDVLKMG